MFLSTLPDALREVQKYSGPEPMQDAKVNPNVYDHVHMKLFRAQRNLYISGFSLFLWLLVEFCHLLCSICTPFTRVEVLSYFVVFSLSCDFNTV